MYLGITRVNGHIEEKDSNRYLVFSSTDENKELLKKYNDFFDGIKNKIKEINNECDYEKDYMKIKFNSDDDLPLNKLLKFRLMTITLTDTFLKKMVNFILKYFQMILCMNYENVGI